MEKRNKKRFRPPACLFLFYALVLLAVFLTTAIIVGLPAGVIVFGVLFILALALAGYQFGRWLLLRWRQ